MARATKKARRGNKTRAGGTNYSKRPKKRSRQTTTTAPETVGTGPGLTGPFSPSTF